MGLYLAGCTDMDIGGIRRAPSAGMERIYMMRDGSMRQLVAAALIIALAFGLEAITHWDIAYCILASIGIIGLVAAIADR